MGFENMNLMEFGHTIGLVGTMFADKDYVYLCWFPGEDTPARVLEETPLTDEDWQKILRQVDLVETEVLQMGKDGKLTKAIVRKTQRQIEGRVSWAVFKRDDYKCRYCGIDGVPLTVDHLVLWEEGGPSIPENLVTACRKCNKARGNTQYLDWIKSQYYERVSSRNNGKTPGLSALERSDNIDLVHKLDRIPRRHSKRKTRK